MRYSPLHMSSSPISLRKLLMILSIVWFAGYLSVTAVCASTCPDCVQSSLTSTSCQAMCGAASAPSHVMAAAQLFKPAKERILFLLIDTSIELVNIWKPPKQVSFF